eukprot:403347343
MEQNVVSILRSFCFEVDRIVDRHKSDEDILNFDFNINYQHHFDNQVQDYQQYQTFNQSSQDHSIQESDQKLHSHRTITNQGTGDKSNKFGKFGFKAKSKSPMRISHEVSNFNNYSQSRIQQTSGQALTQRARQVRTGSQTVQKAQNSREIKDEDQSQGNSNGKKLDAHEADLLVQRLYSYQSKTEAKIKLEQEKQEQQFKLEQPGVPQLQTTANESKFQSLKQRVPIYKRIEEEIKKKESKIREIKERQEYERRQKNLQMGIMDEEDILKMKKDKAKVLKGKFNIESFEQRYDRDIKQLFEKQRKREQEKLNNEASGCSFAPKLQTQNKTNLKSKSPLASTRNSQNMSSLVQYNDADVSSDNQMSNTLTKSQKAVEERLIEQGIKNKIKHMELQKMMQPTFKPNLNKVSMQIAKEKGLQGNSGVQGSYTSRVRKDSNDELEKELISQIERNRSRENTGLLGLLSERKSTTPSDYNLDEQIKEETIGQQSRPQIDQMKLESILKAFRTQKN